MNLTVYNGEDVVFTDNGHWLHPLFELELFISTSSLDPTALFLKDKIIGRGAAVLIARMGIKKCHGSTMSLKAFPVLERFGVEYSYDELVDSLPCKTERILSENVDLEEGYTELARRAGRLHGAMKKILSITELHVYREGKNILKGINLTIDPGDAVLLTGSNGCGKTTLILAIAGLLPLSSGSIWIAGKDSRSVSWRRVRHKLAYLPQEQNREPFPVSVEEWAESGTAGLSLSRSERRQRVQKALEDCHCSHLRKRAFFSLSGGEKRRVSLARFLCQGASLLLLDEPLTFLDRESRVRFLQTIKEVNEKYGITVLMVSHGGEELDIISWRKLSMEEGDIKEGPFV